MNDKLSIIKRRACVTCTNAKAKCTPQAANLCQRCARLGKPCVYLDLPQTKRKQKTAPSRVEILEKKVEQLTSQLNVLTRENGQTSSVTSNPPTNDSAPSQDPELDSTRIAALIGAAADPSHGPSPSTISAMEGQPSIVDRGLLNEAEAERLLANFQIKFVSKFPFVVTAPGETASSLRRREPFFFLCVMAASMGSAHPLRKTVTEDIMKHVTLRVVGGSERNLELLRGLLVYTAWYSYPAEKYHPRLLLLVQFCVSIFYDLGLHKKPSPSLDEQRTILGVYWMSTSLYGTLGRPVAMKHDARIDECVKNLASTENISDRWIAPFIQIQSFLITVDEVYASMQTSDGGALVQVTRRSLQRQFDIILTCVETCLLNCPSSTENSIRADIKFVEMRLEELSLREELWVEDPACITRITMMMGMIQRSKALIETIINLPTSEIEQLTINTSARICAAVGYIPTAVLSILNFITSSSDSDTEAQVQAVIDLADYPDLVTHLCNALETKFPGMCAADKETDVVGSLCSKLRLLARCYPHQVREIVGNAPSQDTMQTTSTMAIDTNEVAMTPQAWPSIYGDMESIFPGDDMQWDNILSNFTGLSWNGS